MTRFSIWSFILDIINHSPHSFPSRRAGVIYQTYWVSVNPKESVCKKSFVCVHVSAVIGTSESSRMMFISQSSLIVVNERASSDDRGVYGVLLWMAVGYYSIGWPLLESEWLYANVVEEGSDGGSGQYGNDFEGSPSWSQFITVGIRTNTLAVDSSYSDLLIRWFDWVRMVEEEFPSIK